MRINIASGENLLLNFKLLERYAKLKAELNIANKVSVEPTIAYDLPALAKIPSIQADVADTIEEIILITKKT